MGSDSQPLLGLGLIAILSACLCTPCVFIYLSVDAFQLQANHISVEGIVTDKSSQNGRDNTPYQIGYKFTVNNNTYFGSSGIPFSTYEHYEIGDPITINYANHEPQNSDIAGHERNPWTYIAMAGGSILFCGFLLIAVGSQMAKG